MSKFNKPHASNRGPNQKGSHHQHGQRNNQNGGTGFANARHGRKPSFKVLTKDEALAKFAKAPLHHSKFVPAKSGGLMAEKKIDGRVVFPDRKGVQPKNDGKPWQFQIVGENPKQTVFFARIVTPETAAASFKIVLRGTKLVCVGNLPRVARFRSTKPAKVRLAEFRSATPNSKFERDERDYDFYADDGYGYHGGCDCGHDHCDGDDCEHGEGSFEHEVASIWDSLPTKPHCCHNCGFEDCRCDGTPTLNPPSRTTLDVLS